MSRYQKVEGNPSLVRDIYSGAIINMNSNEAAQARARKKAKHSERKEIQTMKDDIQEIKSMLNKILEVTNGNHNN